MNTAITISNATPESFDLWASKAGNLLYGATVIPTTGYWGGQREDSVIIVLWDVNETDARELLERYAADHPAEEAFGLMQWPDSQLIVSNHHHTKAA